MQGLRWRVFAPSLFALVLAVILLSAPLHAGVTSIPWMSGWFAGSSGNEFGAPGDDGWWFVMDFYPNIPQVTLNWDCDSTPGLCYGQGYGSIDGGGASGNLWNWNTPDNFYYGGVVTDGWVYVQEWVWEYGEYHYWRQFGFDFQGSWTNGWITSGNGYGSEGDSSYGEFFLTTYSTPEPGTLCLLGSAGVGLAGVLRRRRMH